MCPQNEKTAITSEKHRWFVSHVMLRWLYCMMPHFFKQVLLLFHPVGPCACESRRWKAKTCRNNNGPAYRTATAVDTCVLTLPRRVYFCSRRPGWRLAWGRGREITCKPEIPFGHNPLSRFDGVSVFSVMSSFSRNSWPCLRGMC